MDQKRTFPQKTLYEINTDTPLKHFKKAYQNLNRIPTLQNCPAAYQWIHSLTHICSQDKRILTPEEEYQSGVKLNSKHSWTLKQILSPHFYQLSKLNYLSNTLTKLLFSP